MKEFNRVLNELSLDWSSCESTQIFYQVTQINFILVIVETRLNLNSKSFKLWMNQSD
jgi:hypothetical protein